MNRNKAQISANSKRIASEERRNSKRSTSVVTVRIDEELNNNIDKTCKKLGISKADLIRNYLEMSKYIIKQKSSILSLNDRDFIIIKRSYLRKLIDNEEEEEQIRLGEKLARFINDCARINGKLDDIIYKLDFCDNLGFFRNFIDDNNYVLIDNKFGPQKFVEAFIWRLFTQEEFNKDWTTSKIEDQSKVRSAYQKQVQPINISSSHYSFEFAKLPEVESD
jgi:antitoxin component of RelBE/YafQ-DinJ toxin-antitoxin module